MLKFRCTHCSCPLKATVGVVGTWTECPSCRKRILVPKQAEAGPVAAGRVGVARNAAPAPFQHRDESNRSSVSPQPLESERPSPFTLGLLTVVTAVALSLSSFLFWVIGYFGIFEVYGKFLAIGIIAWVFVGIVVGFCVQPGTWERGADQARSTWEKALRAASFGYVGLTSLAITSAAVVPFEVRHPRNMAVAPRNKTQAETPRTTFYPNGISEAEWAALERNHGRHDVGRAVIRGVPPEKAFRDLLIAEFAPKKSWSVVHELDERTLEIVLPRNSLYWITDRSSLTRRVGTEDSGQTIVFLFDREKADVLLAAEREKAADEKFVQSCVAPANVDTVRVWVEKHTRVRVVLVEVEISLTTPAQLSPMFDDLQRVRGYVTAAKSPDGRCFEAVFAPIEDINTLVARFKEFQVLDVDPLQRRIKVRPDVAKLQRIADLRNDIQDMRDLSGMTGGHQQMLDNIRAETGPEHVIVVTVVHPIAGIGKDRFAVYRRLKALAPILKILSVGRGPYQYVVKFDDFSEFVGKIDFGTIVGVDPSQRTVAVDLDVKNAQAIDWKNWKPGDYTVIDGIDLCRAERAGIVAKYGESRVVEVRAEAMPDDPSEREFARKLIRDGRESFHVYRSGGTEYFLVAPVDDFESYERKIDILQSKFTVASERLITITISRDRMLMRMRAAAK